MTRNPFTRLDHFVLDRIAQPCVDRFSHVPLREQVRFCVMGTFAAWGGRLTHAYNSENLDAVSIGLGGLMLAMLCASYVQAGDAPNAGRARNPNRINPVQRATRTTMFVFTALSFLPAAATFAVAGWHTALALAVACNVAHTVTLYAAACENPPPPAPKAATVPAGA